MRRAGTSLRDSPAGSRTHRAAAVLRRTPGRPRQWQSAWPWRTAWWRWVPCRPGHERPRGLFPQTDTMRQGQEARERQVASEEGERRKKGKEETHEASGVQVGGHIRQLELHALQVGQRLTELLAVLDIGQSVVQARLGGTDTAGGCARVSGEEK